MKSTLMTTTMPQWRQFCLIASVVLLAACDSNNDDSGMMPGDSNMSGSESSADIMTIVARVADSEPFALENEALDAQLMQLFGDSNTTEPVLFEPDDTALTVIGRRQSQ
jgi:hypothetical protein